MEDFLRFISDLVKWFPLHVEIYYSKTMDWIVEVYKKNCADDYPDSEHRRDVNGKGTNDVELCYETGPDMELCFARAHVAVKEWMSKFNGGY